MPERLRCHDCYYVYERDRHEPCPKCKSDFVYPFSLAEEQWENYLIQGDIDYDRLKDK
jgi:RNA polymerase subunit RPABC4/transcription elongation factor Spt4